MRNIRLVVAYDGTEFGGWQAQPGAPTIQGTLERALEKVVGEHARLLGSGRTDAGVHALNQVASFKTRCSIPCANLLKAVNNLLPPAVRVKRADEVGESFHARYDARAKTYRYRILLAPVAPPFIARYVFHYPYAIDRARMALAAKAFEGEHDFTSFAGAGGRAKKIEGGRASAGASQRGEMVRRIFSSRLLWCPRTSILIYEIQGSGFLHHMVRNIVGTLLEVGRGKLAPPDIRRILEARDRARAGPTAPASGLCLVEVTY